MSTAAQREGAIRSVLVVGGGTAGWLAACHLAKKLAPQSPGGIEVTLVESPDIPTIGVGEGTWPTMRNTLKNMGIRSSFSVSLVFEGKLWGLTKLEPLVRDKLSQ